MQKLITFNFQKRMKDIIKKHKTITSKEKFKFINSIIKVLSLNPDLDFNKSIEHVCDFKNKLQVLESRIFSTTTEYRRLGKEV